jgi:phage-related protein
MAHSFTWNGVSSATYSLHVEKITPPIRPATRQMRQVIPGKDGFVTVGDPGMGECMRYAECYLPDLTQRDAILAWLRGSGTVIFSTEPTRYCKASILEQIGFEEDTLASNTLIVAFACQPYRYVYPVPATVEYTSSPGSITNPGTVDAEPTIVVTGSGDITLTIGAKTVQIAALASAITIDVAAGLAYDGTTNLTGSLTGDWPMTIPPGVNAVSWTGTVSKVEIAPNWRYI